MYGEPAARFATLTSRAVRQSAARRSSGAASDGSGRWLAPEHAAQEAWPPGRRHVRRREVGAHATHRRRCSAADAGQENESTHGDANAGHDPDADPRRRKREARARLERKERHSAAAATEASVGVAREGGGRTRREVAGEAGGVGCCQRRPPAGSLSRRLNSERRALHNRGKQRRS